MKCLVSDCTRPCLHEATSSDPISPGKIEDIEILCRAGYRMHDNKGNPRIGLIRSKDLANGELSVWRLDSAASPKLPILLEVLRERGPKNDELLSVFGVSAAQLRGVLENHPLCAIDNTDCGPDWPRHPDHCVLAGCEALGFKELTDPYENVAFVAVRRALLEIFKKNKIWTAAAA